MLSVACVVHQVNLYRGFLAICHPEDPHLSVVERYVELSSGLCMREWRRLPHIVSHVHLPLLQAAQQVIVPNRPSRLIM
jgi:transformation/transcription domain-associated protein